ncbi:hypothetical protein M2R28_10205 [Aeromonas hydrophila]|uniref:hypothetical protein n=1 Tax=Aeromonas hydrophila TaxID=644 RepID=UPI00191EDA6A|nr:hypothetical protein [Aeromonas hydrophila]MBL0431727.1 hypothetical protein [Aeromonas hydrophila]MBL0467698.1 hypothetical protein [Aeromonas hydrophila]MCO4200050.1 hypothetical protein [Aeromonas hydrophila]UNB56616.1 hypothetical protein MKW86_12575 [Aeromonas hydrophila]
MHIDKDNLRSIVFKNHYTPAIQSIEMYGRYWFSETRQAAYMLSSLLEQAGMNVVLLNYPPSWEFVICIVESHDRDSLLEIAYQRHELLEQGIDVAELPI